MTRDQAQIIRLNYSSMDYIRDVGAMFLALVLLTEIILNRIFNLPVLLENDMISGIFRERVSGAMYASKRIELSYFGWYCAWISDTFCCCCQPRDRDVVIREAGTRRMNRMLDVSTLARENHMMKSLIRSKSSNVEEALVKMNY